tara:strand:+ start:1682 stop:2173 length:492 start_codon:yes stop_codon:yes gene_type:complete
MKALNYLIILLLVTSFSCSEKQKDDSTDPIEITKEIEESFESYVNHVNTKGIKGVDSYFSKDKRFYWIEDGVMQYPNRESLLKGIEEFYPTVSTVSLKVSKTNIEVIDSNNVMLYVEYKEDILLNSGYKFTLDGAMSILMIPEDGIWKFLMGHSSIKKPRGDY